MRGPPWRNSLIIMALWTRGATTNHIWTLPGLQGSLFRIDWAGEDCSHISGLRLRNMHSSGPDGIRWLTPHQGHELWVRGSYQVWSSTVLRKRSRLWKLFPLQRREPSVSPDESRGLNKERL